MKLSSIIILSALFVTINGAWFVGLVQPILLTFGATFAALNFDFEPMLDMKNIVWKKWYDPRGADVQKGMEEQTDSKGRRYIKDQEGEKIYLDELRPGDRKDVEDYIGSKLDKTYTEHCDAQELYDSREGKTVLQKSYEEQLQA